MKQKPEILKTQDFKFAVLGETTFKEFAKYNLIPQIKTDRSTTENLIEKIKTFYEKTT